MFPTPRFVQVVDLTRFAGCCGDLIGKYPYPGENGMVTARFCTSLLERITMRILLLLGLLILLVTASTSSPAQAASAAETAATPRPEYPRPDFQRDHWLNLNGMWAFAFDPDDQGLAQRWFDPASAALSGSIVVPFPWQSTLSGVAAPDQTGVAWYRRSFTVPADWQGQRVVLHFGAVDYRAQVWVNGQPVGEHEGGYDPFEFDVTDVLAAGANVVDVRVDDPADLAEIPHGKQSSTPPNPWDDVDFTTVSGIWQTVWLEARPAAYIQQAHITPDVSHQQATFAVTVESPASGSLDLQISVQAPDGRTFAQAQTLAISEAGTQTTSITVDLPDPLLWEPETPNLYTVDLALSAPDGVSAADVVHTYFGMRSIAVAGQNVLLNGHPIYLMSALDQGYWADGLYTAPSDEALRADIAYAKQIGFNGLRMHLKIEDPRWAYWADRLGMLLWNDAPSPVAFTALARERLTHDLQAMIARDYNHPSIVVWSPYNESWGLEFRSDADVQSYLGALYDQIKAWDPTRLVVDNSGWRHVKTDIANSHKYTDNSQEWRSFMTQLATSPMDVVVLGHPFFAQGHQYGGEPLMITEYGTGWGEERAAGFLWQTTEIRHHGSVVGYTYTELYDVEHELAGLAHYDRTPKAVTYDLATINSADFVGLDYQGNILQKRGNPVDVPVFVSAYGQPALSTAVVNWRIESIGDQPETLLEGSYGTLALTPYGVTDLEPLSVTLPDQRGSVRLWVEVRDPDGNLRGQNSLDFGVF